MKCQICPVHKFAFFLAVQPMIKRRQHEFDCLCFQMRSWQKKCKWETIEETPSKPEFGQRTRYSVPDWPGPPPHTHTPSCTRDFNAGYNHVLFVLQDDKDAFPPDPGPSPHRLPPPSPLYAWDQYILINFLVVCIAGWQGPGARVRQQWRAGLPHQGRVGGGPELPELHPQRWEPQQVSDGAHGSQKQGNGSLSSDSNGAGGGTDREIFTISSEVRATTSLVGLMGRTYEARGPARLMGRICKARGPGLSASDCPGGTDRTSSEVRTSNIFHLQLHSVLDDKQKS